MDDVPIAITPDAIFIENDGVPGTADQYMSDLNFIPGADGVGSVKFNAADVDAGIEVVSLTPGAATSTVVATDGAGNELMVAGQKLYLYLSDDSTTLTAKTAGGTVGFTVTLDASTGKYVFNAEAMISNGTEVTATDLSSVGGGNVTLKAISDIGGTLQDVVLTTKSGYTVNTNNSEIGIGGGNSLSPTIGDAIRIDLTNGNVTGNGGNAVYTYASHNTTTSFRQVVNLTSGATTAAIKVTAILADGDTIFYGDPSGESIVSIADIHVYSGTLSQVSAGTATDVTGQVTIQNNGDGTFDIVGIQNGWIYEVETTNSFSALQIDALTDGGAGNFKLGFFSYGETTTGDSIELNYNIIGVDGDGDAVNGSVDISLFPDEDASTGSNLLGTAGDDVLLGTNLDDILQGGDGVDHLAGNSGNDFLFGGSGHDVLHGGSGSDTLAGGIGNDTMFGDSGSDTFKFNSEDIGNGVDDIKDFHVGAIGEDGDVLDFTGVLTGANVGTLNQFLEFSNVIQHLDGTTTADLGVDTNGSEGGSSFTPAATITMTGLSADVDTGGEVLNALINNNEIKIG